MVCLDTSVIIGLLRKENRATKFIEKLEATRKAIGTTSITAYELLKGAKISSCSKENTKTVEKLLGDLLIYKYDYACAAMASEIYKDLKNKGIPIGEFDILIAAICIVNDKTLISNDSHFKKIKHLKYQTF